MTSALRLSTVILPVRRWHEGGRAEWQRAEDLGFHAAYTYDHLSWRGFRDTTWFGAVPTLTAAATVTARMRLGTLVTSPNFRHPVTLAKDLITLDDVSGGRITLGIGAGGTGFDATALGQAPWSARERGERFAEFTELLDRLLTAPAVTHEGTYYSANEARTIPGCVQQPRVLFALAATGPRGFALTARYGQAWITTGDPKLFAGGTQAESAEAIGRQLASLDAACDAIGRDGRELDRILLTGFTPDPAAPFASLDAFVEFAGVHAALGITEIVVHAPIPDSEFAIDPAVFEKIAAGALSQLSR